MKLIKFIVKLALNLAIGLVLVFFGVGLGFGADDEIKENPEVAESIEVKGPLTWLIKFILELSKGLRENELI